MLKLLMQHENIAKKYTNGEYFNNLTLMAFYKVHLFFSKLFQLLLLL